MALWLLVAGIVELGRALAISHVLQNASRLAAREMALMPGAGGLDFGQALGLVFDPAHLVIDVACADSQPGGAGLEGYIEGLPVLNRALAPVMVHDEIVAGVAGTVRVLRYPGELLTGLPGDAGACNRDLTVGIPRPIDEDATRFEWVPVVEAVPGFNFQPGPSPGDGTAAVRINYPFQSVAFAAWRPSEVDPESGRVLTYSAIDAGPIAIEGTMRYDDNDLAAVGTPGLGQLEMLGRSVRSYRRVLSGQAAFRRELTD